MRDGERLKKVLADHGKDWSDLRDATGKSRAMVYQYFAMERFSPNVLEVVSDGLRKMGIEPTAVQRPQPGEVTDPDQLRQMLGGIPDALLPAVRRIMKASPQEKITLEAIINDRLERRK